MDFSGLFEMQGMLFTIMILGYIFRKAGMISDSGKALLTDLVLYVTLPASILKSFQIEFSHQILVSCLSVIAVGRWNPDRCVASWHDPLPGLSG